MDPHQQNDEGHGKQETGSEDVDVDVDVAAGGVRGRRIVYRVTNRHPRTTSPTSTTAVTVTTQ